MISVKTTTPTIRKGALFVADAHFPHHGDAFIKLLRQMYEFEYLCQQLFLMGDNFDLLFGYNDYITGYVSEAIDLINGIAEKTEVYYFEGNHDFCLKPLFPNVTVFPYAEQPSHFLFREKVVALAHGDRYDVPLRYRLYTYWLRKKMTLTLLRPWQKKIIDAQLEHLRAKEICHEIDGFDEKVKRIMTHYRSRADLVLEGHFHQRRIIGRYYSLPSLACHGEITIAKEDGLHFIPWQAWLY